MGFLWRWKEGLTPIEPMTMIKNRQLQVAIFAGSQTKDR
jgi:hypothetical protein